MRVAINLASRPFTDIAPALKTMRIAMGALALGALGLFLGLHAIHGKAEAARAREHALDARIAQVRQEQQRYQALMRQPDNALTLEQSESLNRLFDEKAFSWTLTMEDLERVLPAGVQVQTLEPTIKDGQTSVRLHVLGPRDKDVELVQNLEHSLHFVLPRIVGESAETTGGPNQQAQPVSASNRMVFDVLADYKPGTLEERKLAREKAAAAAKTQAGETPQAGSPAGRPPYTGTARPKAPVQPRPTQPHQGVQR